MTDGSRRTFAHLKSLKWPDDKRSIAKLSLEEKIVWYTGQDPHDMIDLDANAKLTPLHFEDEKAYQEYLKEFKRRKNFRRFWYWHYIVPLKLKRFVFWFKFW